MRTPRPWPLPQLPVRRGDLLARGVTPAMLATQLKTGRLLRLRPEVYLDAARWPVDEREQHLLLGHAEQIAHPEAVLSHGTAGLIWQLPEPDLAIWAAQPPTVTLPGGGGHRPWRRAAIHRVGPLPGHHVTRDPDGFAVTTVARTAVDLARGHALPEALVVLDAAARRIVESMVSSPRRREYANPRLKAVAVAALDEAARLLRSSTVAEFVALADPRRESPAESLSVGHMRLAGIPMPEVQVPIRVAGRLFYLDFYWEEADLIGEVDGAVKYRDPQAIIDEKEREQLLRDSTHGMVRWLGKEIRFQPRVVMDRILRALQC